MGDKFFFFSFSYIFLRSGPEYMLRKWSESSRDLIHIFISFDKSYTLSVSVS